MSLSLTKENLTPYNYNRIFLETGTYTGGGVQIALWSGFEKVISTFLELLHFSTIHLGKDGETIRENKMEIGSADILLYEAENENLFLIDCTLRAPSNQKIDNIRNSADYISRKMGYQIKPIIFCASNCPQVKEGAVKTNVKIYDLEDLKQFLSTYKQGYISSIISTIIG